MTEIARNSVIVEFDSDLSKLEEGLKNAEKQIVTSTKVINKNLKEIVDEAQKTGKGIEKAFNPLQEQAKKSEEELKKLNVELRNEIRSLNALEAESKKLTKSLQENTDEVNELTEALQREQDVNVKEQIKAEIEQRQRKGKAITDNIAQTKADIAVTTEMIGKLKEQGASTGKLRGLVEDFTGVLTPFGGTAAEVGEKINLLADAFDATSEKVGKAFANFGEQASERLKKIGEALSPALDSFRLVGDAARKGADRVSAAFLSLGQKLKPVRDFFQPAIAVFGVFGEKAGAAFKSLQAGFANATAGLGRFVSAARALPIVQKGFQLGAVGARVFGAALAATGIGALVVAVGALIVAFTQTTAGAKLLKKFIEPIQFVVQKLIQAFGEFGLTIVESLKDPQQALKDLGDFILNNLINRFKAFGVILEGILTLDFKKVVDGTAQLATGITDATGKLAALKKEAEEAYRVGQQIAALRDKADQMDQTRATTEARISREMFNQQKILENENATTEQKTAALKEILRLEKEQINRQKETLSLRLKAREIELASLNDTSGAAKQELDELRAEIANLDLQLSQKEFETGQAIAALRVTFLQSLRDQLSKTMKSLEDLDPGSTAFEKAAKKARDLQDEIKKIEQAIADALNPPTKLELLQRKIEDLTTQLSKAEIGTDSFTELAARLREAKKEAELLQQSFDNAFELKDLVKIDSSQIAAAERELKRLGDTLADAILSGDNTLVKKIDDQLNEVKLRLLSFKATAGDKNALNEYLGLTREQNEKREAGIRDATKKAFEGTKAQLDADEAERARIAAQIAEDDARNREQLKNSALSALQSLNEIASQQVQVYQEAVGRQTERIERFKELARTGSAEQLVIEEERLAKLTELQERAAARQRRIAEAQLLINQAVTISESVKAIATAFGSSGPLGIVTGIATSAALALTLATMASQVSGIFGNLPQFRKGSEFIEGPGSGTSDSILARVSRGERIVPFRENAEIARIGGIPNKKLPEAVAAWKSGPVIIDAIREGNESMIREMQEVRRELTLSRLDNQKTRVNILATRKGLAAMVSEQTYQDKFARR